MIQHVIHAQKKKRLIKTITHTVNGVHSSFSILAKGVFLSYSPLKLFRTPRLAWGFRHTIIRPADSAETPAGRRRFMEGKPMDVFRRGWLVFLLKDWIYLFKLR